MPSPCAALSTPWSTPTAAANFRSHAYVRTLREAQLRGSMGPVGACQDNAAMESFFSLLQTNVLNRRRWTSRNDLRLAIVTWIGKTYRRRRQDRLGHLTPIEVEAPPTDRSRGLETTHPPSQPKRGQSRLTNLRGQYS